MRTSFQVNAALIRGSLVTGAVLGWLGLIPLAALLAALREPPKHPLGLCLGRAVALFPRFTLLAGATLFVQGAISIAFVFASRAVHHRLPASATQPTADVLAFLLLAIGLSIALSVGIVQDLVRAQLVISKGSIVWALREALRTLRRTPFSLLGSWVVFALSSSVIVLGGAFMAHVLDVSHKGDARLFAVAVIHQLVVFAYIAARTCWLAVALDASALSAPSPASADRSADSVAPVDPSLRPAA